MLQLEDVPARNAVVDPIFDPTLSHTLRRQDRWSREVKNFPSHFKRPPWTVLFLDVTVQLQ